MSWIPLFLLTVSLPIALWAESTVIRGDSSALPPLDYSKQFDMKGSKNFDRQYQVKTLEMKTFNLPTYSGSLKTVPLTEWEGPTTDRYSQSINLREFLVKEEVEKYARQALLDGEIEVPENAKNLSERQTSASREDVETGTVGPSKALGGEDMRQLINRGVTEAGPIKMGKGFGERSFGIRTKEAPEKKSQPK